MTNVRGLFSIVYPQVVCLTLPESRLRSLNASVCQDHSLPDLTSLHPCAPHQPLRTLKIRPVLSPDAKQDTHPDVYQTLGFSQPSLRRTGLPTTCFSIARESFGRLVL